ncbi:MAG: tRNA glutamyl-Q(34) synthetase GluQRS [Oscillospiraceae bacterium]|nr:tRNA glutamyl-Q(34) synthetase GluQRS [Oscillospiraceae bacterium]
MEPNVVGRFAPSPSGYLHMGNLLASLLAWLDCRALGGTLIFRMEDLDPARSRPEYAAAAAEDLRWLGLDWDEGWPDPAYAQSRRGALYEEAFERLRAMNLVYPCWCTRAERLAAASAPHPGEAVHDPGCPCARLTRREREERFRSGRRPAWKLRMPELAVSVDDGHYGLVSQNLARDAGDCIVRRADGVYAYQLAVSVDDLLMGVTRVVRGRDLLASAPRQRWLIETLGGAAPAYCHSPLLTSGAGKLSKRLGSLSTQALRQTTSPEALVGRLAFLCGLRETDAPVTPRELLADFDWARVKTEDIEI